MTKSLSSVSDQMLEVYGLKRSGFFLHDAIHAMTGFGIGVADELRVAIIERRLNQTKDNRERRTLETAFEREANLYRHLYGFMTRGDYIGAEENGIDQKRFHKIQLTAVKLDPREVERLFNLGEKMHQTILDISGKNWVDLANDLPAIDFKEVDFTTEAHLIKNKFEKAANRQVARATERLFFNAIAGTAREGRIPAAGAPWHGHGRKDFYPARKNVNRYNR